jgi:DNA-binding response OmpR family regulator
MRILLADGDAETLDVTAYALRREGFQVVPCTTADEALRRWREVRPQLLLLDAALPGFPAGGLGGLEVCRRVRQEDDTPVVVLSERADDEHVVQAFRVGADDVIFKPFSPRQLIVRLQAVCRRRGPAETVEPQRVVRAGALALDADTHEAHVGERTVRLTPTEFRLLYILAVNAGRVVAAPRLVEYAWGYDESDVALLKTHVCHLRRKLGLVRGGPGDIQSVARVGYRLGVAGSDHAAHAPHAPRPVHALPAAGELPSAVPASASPVRVPVAA